MILHFFCENNELIGEGGAENDENRLRNTCFPRLGSLDCSR